MAKLERIHEVVKGPIDADYIKQRTEQGWRLASVEWQVEWERETKAAKSEAELHVEEAPFGTHVAGGNGHLEEDPTEMEFLLSMMELIIQDISLTKVAEELSRKGFRTRNGAEWGPVAVFNMLPRLIEVTPRIFSSEQWAERRKYLVPVY